MLNSTEKSLAVNRRPPAGIQEESVQRYPIVAQEARHAETRCGSSNRRIRLDGRMGGGDREGSAGVLRCGTTIHARVSSAAAWTHVAERFAAGAGDCPRGGPESRHSLR